jgi:1,4-dihydroxy-2-naphthoate polyprenyltransferase
MRHFTWESLVLSVPVGLMATALLVVNNTRDIDTDRRANKRTLAVRFGRERSRKLFAALIYASYPLALLTWIFGPLRPWLLLSWLSIPLAIPVVKVVRNHTDGPSLNRALAGTGRLQLVFCLLLSAGILLSR